MMMSPWVYFPSFSEGLSLRVREVLGQLFQQLFPFLFGGTFIEGFKIHPNTFRTLAFPFLFGGTFIEGSRLQKLIRGALSGFPFLFGGTFIEGTATHTAGLT